MPIAELLGVQIDMQLLLKLSLSVTAVLLVSWAYRFYSSREARKPLLCGTDGQETQGEACRGCEATGQSQDGTRDSGEDEDEDGQAEDEDKRDEDEDGQGEDEDKRDEDEDGQGEDEDKPGEDEDRRGEDEDKPSEDEDRRGEDEDKRDEDEDEQTQPSSKEFSIDDLTSEGSCDWTAEDPPPPAEKVEAIDISSAEDTGVDGETARRLDEEDLASDGNISPGGSLNLPPPTSSGTASPAGRRSPCLVQKLDRCVGVGRELRHNLEHQGAYSSFRSKAEIKVEDANVVLEAAGGQIVRGKIYDYFVESSSHCVNSPALLPESDGRFGSRDTSEAEAAPPAGPPTVCDAAKDCVSAGGAKHTPKPALQRKESYISAAENAEISPPPRTSAPRNSAHPLISPSAGGKSLDTEERADLETVAGAQFVHFSAKSLESTDLEILTRKLDLGNCLEVLDVAKKYGQISLQDIALRVMSDNYLQVLKAPALYGRLMAGERDQIRRQRTRGRKYLVVADMDPQDWQRSAGLQAEEPQRSALYYYDDYQDAWHVLCPVPKEVVSKACAVCTMDNYLFVAVGCQSTEAETRPSKRVFCYNPLTSIWTEISPMNEARPHCKLAALDGFIYAIGGECLSSVERYDPRADRWTFVAPLPNDTFAVAHRVTVCNGELFVSGGTLKYTLLRYSPKSDSWKPSLLVGSKDRTAEMVAVGRFLYRFDVNPLLGVSVYRYHTVARLWYECSTRRLHRCPVFHCVAMDDAIFCISRQFTMRFLADEISPAFGEEELSVLSAARGILFPAVLSLPDKKPRQTSV